MTGEQPPGLQAKLHESVAAVVITALTVTMVVVLLTSPCWGAALIIWTVTR